MFCFQVCRILSLSFYGCFIQNGQQMNYASCFHEILCQGSFVGYLDLGISYMATISCPEVMARYSGTELLVMVGKSVQGGVKDDGLHVMVAKMM